MIKADPYFTHAQFSEPDGVLAVADPGNTFPYVKAMWHYARGVAHARRGEIASARNEMDALEEIAVSEDFSAMMSGGVPAPDVLQLAQHVLEGRIAQAQNRHEDA